MTATSIEWTDVTWNPVRGCSRVSPGCENCYAERTAARFAGPGQPYEGLVRLGPNGPRWTGRVRLVTSGGTLDAPLSWRSPRRVFVNSMSDLFHEALGDLEIAAAFAVMVLCPQHTFQCLTKRADRMRDWMNNIENRIGIELHLRTWASFRLDVPIAKAARAASLPLRWPPPNVWLGVSVEDQQRADERIPLLLETPAAVRFLSVEPLLGPVDLRQPFQRDFPDSFDTDGTDPRATWAELLDWVIVGGESGPAARPCDVAWIRSIVEQCRAAAVPVFVKQLGSMPVGEPWRYPPRDRKGGDPDEWPEDLRVRQFPEVHRGEGAE